jgi:hypothetical protein
MHNVLVLYAPDGEAARSAAARVSDAFDGSRFTVTARPAGTSHIPNLAAADLVVFATEAGASQGLPSDWNELVRAFAGVNLAAKVGGILSLGKTGDAAGIRKALRDTEITLLADEPALEKLSDADLRLWVGALCGRFREFLDARGL